ncbi:hypothetical protein, partial [Methylomonas albis]
CGSTTPTKMDFPVIFIEVTNVILFSKKWRVICGTSIVKY